jgi:hypothetical protein
MQKLIPVEEAKALMNAAVDWSVWGWLTEKRKLRATADKAWEALDEAEARVRATWSDDLQKAWQELDAEAALESNPRAKRQYEKAKEAARAVDQQTKSAAKKLKEADEKAYSLRMQAEETFDEADRRMSTSMACEGARQAIDAWETREKYIRKMEALARRTQPSGL